jgi:hypothetical protein
MSFDPEQHDAHVAASYERLFKFDAFDRLIDMALDGQITVEEAIGAYKGDLALEHSPADAQDGNA